MDWFLILSAFVLLLTAFAEILCFFRPLRKKQCFVKILPLFVDDSEFSERLEKLSLECEKIIIVEYSADEEQSELCRKFICNNPDTELISCKDLEKYLHKMFAFEEKI